MGSSVFLRVAEALSLPGGTGSRSATPEGLFATPTPQSPLALLVDTPSLLPLLASMAAARISPQNFFAMGCTGR